MKPIYYSLLAAGTVWFGSALIATAASVTLKDNGDGTVTMNNGIVTMTCSKGGDVSYFALNALITGCRWAAAGRDQLTAW